MSKRIARFAIAALGLVAVSLLLFQPICEAGQVRLPHAQLASQASASDGGDSCCSIVPAVAFQAATATAETLSVAVPEPTMGSPAFRPETLGCGAVASAAPLLVPRYYARSARIQR